MRFKGRIRSTLRYYREQLIHLCLGMIYLAVYLTTDRDRLWLWFWLTWGAGIVLYITWACAWIVERARILRRLRQQRPQWMKRL